MQFDRAGISTQIFNGKCILLERCQNDRIMGEACSTNENMAFTVCGSVVKTTKHTLNMSWKTTATRSNHDLWHRGLGYPGKAVLESMFTEQVSGMNTQIKGDVIDCDICVDAKQTKKSSTGTLTRARLEHVVHSNLIGPIEPLGKSRYILTFIVEDSRFTKI